MYDIIKIHRELDEVYMKNKFLGYSEICRKLIDYICREDVCNYSSRFVDSDGDEVEADMGYLLDGLREFEIYFELKAEDSK